MDVPPRYLFRPAWLRLWYKVGALVLWESRGRRRVAKCKARRAKARPQRVESPGKRQPPENAVRNLSVRCKSGNV